MLTRMGAYLSAMATMGLAGGAFAAWCGHQNGLAPPAWVAGASVAVLASVLCTWAWRANAASTSAAGGGISLVCALFFLSSLHGLVLAVASLLWIAAAMLTFLQRLPAAIDGSGEQA